VVATEALGVVLTMDGAVTSGDVVKTHASGSAHDTSGIAAARLPAASRTAPASTLTANLVNASASVESLSVTTSDDALNTCTRAASCSEMSSTGAAVPSRHTAR
jgi:hypothetical protein